MIEVKADGLEGAFDAVLQEERMAALEADIGALRHQVAVQAVQAQRPVLDGVKGAGGAGNAADPKRTAFVERYLRRGLEAGVELKSFSGATDGAGGYAVPREIDQLIEVALKSVSPIRAIANVVRTGTAGYRKLVTSGGTVSGWASETGARAETATPVFNEIAPPRGELFANPAARSR
jgi:HK97 family phage major capsid protein